jgi:hypothetical protein
MKKKLWALAAIVMGMMGHAQAASAFDFDTESAPFAIGPASIPSIYAVSPTGGDATLVLRATLMISNGWFDATAPYTPASVAVHSNLGRRPASEHTQANMNIACFYASYHVLNSIFPAQNTEWRNLLLDVGLDPDDNSTDLATPVGIGNVAGAAVALAFENDGMNQLGTANGRGEFYARPFEDTTGYQPVNTAYRLDDPSRWQPQMNTAGRGLFNIQQFVTPQFGRTIGFGIQGENEARSFRLPKPVNSDFRRNRAGYRAQAAEVVAESAALTDEKKMIAELFNDKLLSYGASTGFVVITRGLNLRQSIELDFLVQAAKWDAGIAGWNNKRFYDAVRPTSAIRHVYANQNITAYGGRGRGTVTNLPGKLWQSYLPVADHPDYPSGTSLFCSAHVEAMRAYLGSDTLGWTVPFPAGSSRFEPGITPAADMSFTFDTWTEFEAVCSRSRVWGGVHFTDACTQGLNLGRATSERSINFVFAHINGTIDDGDDDDDDCHDDD